MPDRDTVAAVFLEKERGLGKWKKTQTMFCRLSVRINIKTLRKAGGNS